MSNLSVYIKNDGNIQKKQCGDPRDTIKQVIWSMPLDCSTNQERQNELFERKLNLDMERNLSLLQQRPEKEIKAPQKRQPSQQSSTRKNVRNLIKIESLQGKMLKEIIKIKSLQENNLEEKVDLVDLEYELWILKLFAKKANESVLKMTFKELADNAPNGEEMGKMTMDQLRSYNNLVTLLQGKEVY